MAENAPVAPPTVAVAADPPGDINLLKAAARLAVDLNLPFLEKPARGGFDMLLTVTADALDLRILRGEASIRGGRPVSADPTLVDTTSKAGRSLEQPIAKAVGLNKRKKSDRPLTVIDATAGWGEDAWLLASLGCRVLAVERNKIIATLLRDGLFRAGAEHPEVLTRIHLVTADARHMLRRIARGGAAGAEDDLPASMQDFLHPDVVYLDPMFPGAKARKTAERKPMKVARRLAGDDLDCGELFDFAALVAQKRVVVKRPTKAEPLRGKPTMSFKTKAVRYDVYVQKKQ